MPEESYKDEGWLLGQYEKGGKSIKMIADSCGVSYSTIHYHMDKFGIERRGLSEAQKETNSRNGANYKDECWLREQYLERGKTTYDIATESGVSQSTISNWLNEFDIETRDHVEAAENWVERNLPDTRYKDGEWLREKYIIEGLAQRKIANICDVARSAVQAELQRQGIETRGRGYTDAPTGEEHWLWNGGQCPYGEGWTNSKKGYVRERDGHECVYCDLTQKEHLDEWGTKLHVHHITPAREFEDAEKRNSTDNLETVCIECHRTVERMYPLRPMAAD